MLRLLGILWNSFRMALQELKVNKLRTFLSLFGISIGIFCIISVLTAVNSLENKIQSDIQALGTNTIYIAKFDYSNGPDRPWWKYIKRPDPKFDEVKFIKEKSTLAANVAYINSNNATLAYGNNQLSSITVDCVTEDFNKIQDIKIAYGRYFSQTEFLQGTAVGIIGYENARLLFGDAEKAVGKAISMNQRHVQIIGVIEKKGSSGMGDAFNYDQSLMLTYRYFASIWDTNSNNNDGANIVVNGKPNVPTSALLDELRGIMRQVRKLSPTTEDNFSLNDVSSFSEKVSSFFGSVNLGGWAIAGLSLIVGGFGVANIMFVTVRERTSQIGLKKAIGAKSRTILTEFLLESSFLCIIGGTFGLLLVYLLAFALSNVLPFPITVAPHIILIAISVCIVLGVLSGIIPARTAAKMNPVDAIRSK